MSNGGKDEDLAQDPGKEGRGADVLQACQRVIQAAGSGGRQLIYIALLCFVGVPAVAASAWFIARITGWVE